jgi:SagB-type dehydrogenase family enzyme
VSATREATRGTEARSARAALERRLAMLSDLEVAELLPLFDDVSIGRRFWEDAISTLYNERVKFRANTRDDSGVPIPAAPESEAGIFAPIPIVKAVDALDRIALPDAEPVALDVGRALERRRSRRDYTGGSIPAGQLATMLHLAAGVTGRTRGYGYNTLPLRTFPSSGGLGVPEVYVVVRAVGDIPAGLYHFDPTDRSLGLLRPGDHGRLLQECCLGQPMLATASVTVLVTGCFARLRWKYGERAYRYMCMDIGYLGQSLYLAGEGLGLGVCAIAGFMDDAVEQFLGVDGRDEIPLLLTTIGVVS